MSKHKHDFRLAGSHRYGAITGSCTKPMYECSCGAQKYGVPIKGWWTVQELRAGVRDHGRTGLFGRHKHTFEVTARQNFDALGGPHYRVLERCSCGRRRVLVCKGSHRDARDA